jgi:glycosyltransferase involved in cell wall biosynthesis
MQRSLRILFLSHSPNNPNGGASRIYHMLSDELRSRSHEVDLFHMEDFGLPANKTCALVARRLALPHYLSRFGGSKKVETYDVVMASSGMAAPLFRRPSRGKRAKFVNHIHGLAVYDHIANLNESELGHCRTSAAYRLITGPFQHRWDIAGIDAADLTIVQNNRDLAWVRSRLSNRKQATKISAAVHPDLMSEGLRATEISSKTAGALLWFGTWEARKGSYYMPRSFNLIRQAIPEARLTIGGTGRSRGEVIEQFDAADRSHVTVLPAITIAEQIELFHRSSIFMFPSLSEGFGLALVEALCFQLAVVTTNTAFGGDELTDDLNAKIVFPSSEHIARATIDLIRSRSVRECMARNGQDVAKRFSLHRMVSEYETAFFNLCARSSTLGSAEL